MSVYQSIRSFEVEELPGLSKEGRGSFVEKLARSGRIRGEYPTDLNVIEELGRRTSKDSGRVHDLVNCIFCDPILALRILSIANSTFYNRGTSTRAISGALSQIGMARAAEIASDLATPRSASSLYVGRAVSSLVLHESLFALAAVRRIFTIKNPRSDYFDIGQLLVSLSYAPLLLLSYYKPNVTALCELKPLDDESWISRKRFRSVLGTSSTDIGCALSEILGLPSLFVELLKAVDASVWSGRLALTTESREYKSVAEAAHLAIRIAREAWSLRGPQKLFALSSELAKRHEQGLHSLIPDILASLPGDYREACRIAGIRPLRLPDYLFRYGQSADEGKSVPVGEKRGEWPSLAERINPFLYELRACFKTVWERDDIYRMPQAIWCTLNGLIRAARFERSMFLVRNEAEDTLTPLFFLGRESEGIVDTKPRFIQSPDREHMPDVKALATRRVVFHGDPIQENWYPFVAIPAVWNSQVVGVFYADRNSGEAIDTQEQIGLIALGEEWQDISGQFL